MERLTLPNEKDSMNVEIGVFDHLDRSDAPLAEYYEQRLRIAEAYDRAGFFCYHLAEHHSTPIGLAPSPSVFLSAVAQRTKRLRFAPLVYLLPFYHPLRLIEEICMLDQMSGGRLEIGLGRGISVNEMGYYGIDPAEARDRYNETFEVLRQGLSRDTVTFEGKYYRFTDIHMELRPLQRRIPLWYGVHEPESAERVAREGFNVVTNEGGAQARVLVERYKAAWADAGHAFEPKAGAVRFIVVAESDDEALAIGRRSYPKWYESFNYISRKHNRPVHHPKAPSFDAAIAEGTAVAGAPQTVADALHAQIEATGLNYILGQFAFGTIGLDECLRSVDLFARAVLPALREPALAS